jgi:hypothetical protein
MIGTIVCVKCPELGYNNGAPYAAAIITRTWPDPVVNVIAFPDAAQPVPIGSLPIFSSFNASQNSPDANRCAWLPE